MTESNNDEAPSRLLRQFQCVSIMLIGGLVTPPLSAVDWTINELHLQYGKLSVPTFSGGGSETTWILTAQHADEWKYGENFLFVDFIDADKTGSDIWGEFYSNFSMEKITGNEISIGAITDVGVVLGLNYGREAKVLKYLPGVRLAWDVPGFGFLNTDFTFYIDDNSGVADGGAPKEEDSFRIDAIWMYPFEIAGRSFSIEGHVAYVGERRNEFGEEVSWSILGQPQFRYDLGKDLFGRPERLFVGFEWQFWINKQGDSDTDENALQLLVVGRF